MLIVGVDPGLSGGIASYNGSDLFLFEIPSMKTKAKGNELDFTAVVDVVSSCFSVADHIFIEKVGAMPHQGVSSMFKFGYVAGALYMAFCMCQIPITLIPPQTWKTWLKLPAAKDASVARACQLFPKHASEFKGPRGGLRDGVAEAALIAYYGYTQLNNGGRL